jgi:hypothetical protein
MGIGCTEEGKNCSITTILQYMAGKNKLAENMTMQRHTPF